MPSRNISERFPTSRERSTVSSTSRTSSFSTTRELHAGDYFAAAIQQQEWKALLKAAKPAAASHQAIADRAARVIEAEDFTRGNVLKDTTGYGQGIGVIYNKGELPNVAEYDVPVETAGIFQLEIRYAAAAARGVQLSINGDLLKSDAAGRVTGSWNPDTQTWEIVGLFPLKTGINTIRLERAQPFPHIDKLLLVPGQDAAGKPLVAPGPPADGYRLKSDIIGQWIAALEQSAAEPSSPFAVWHAWHKEGKLAAGESSSLAARFADLEPTSSAAIVARYGKLFAEADEAWKKLLTGAAKPATALDDPALEPLRKLLYDAKGPLAVPKNAEKFYPADEQSQLAVLQNDVKALQETLLKLPETMAVSEAKIEDLRVHLRGSHLTLGESVARRLSTRLFHGGTGAPRTGRKRPPPTGRLAGAPRASADEPRDRQSRLAMAFRRRAGAVARQFWLSGRAPHASGAARLAVAPLRRARMVAQSALHRLIMLSSTYQMSTRYELARRRRPIPKTGSGGG